MVGFKARRNRVSCIYIVVAGKKSRTDCAGARLMFCAFISVMSTGVYRIAAFLTPPPSPSIYFQPFHAFHARLRHACLGNPGCGGANASLTGGAYPRGKAGKSEGGGGDGVQEDEEATAQGGGGNLLSPPPSPCEIDVRICTPRGCCRCVFWLVQS